MEKFPPISNLKPQIQLEMPTKSEEEILQQLDEIENYILKEIENLKKYSIFKTDKRKFIELN